VFVAALCVAGIVALMLWRRPTTPQPDTGAVMGANARGIGRMERFEYAEAQKEFEEASRLDRDWLPAQINLGIALFNQNTPETVARAQSIFDTVLAKEPNNKHAHYCLGIILMERGRKADAYAHFNEVNQLDPDDAHVWLRLGPPTPPGDNRPKRGRALNGHRS
jgi:tetratricopeptide (TPR) repeat protein